MPKSRINPQGNVPTRAYLSQLVNHIGRTRIHMEIMLNNQFQCLVIKNISGVDNCGGSFRFGPTTAVASCQGSQDLPGTDRIDQGTLLPNEVYNCQVGARLLGKPHGIELVEFSTSLHNCRCIVDIGRCTELRSKICHRDPGDLTARGGKSWLSGHRSIGLGWQEVKNNAGIPAGLGHRHQVDQKIYEPL
jgi:hypothetical protein